jgi:uncharacterized protein YodC (DUF2158 family)
MTDDEKAVSIALRQATAIMTGAVVRLKSGGPTMTVSEVKSGRAACQDYDVARCHWIDESGGGREYTFPVTTLIRI